MSDGPHPNDIAEFGLGPRLETRTISHNPWLAVLEWDALQVLQAVCTDDPIAFAFTESRKLQAGANTAYRQILVSGGLGDMICRLCAAIVGAGIFIKFGGPEISWSPEPVETKPVANVLESDFFDWENGHIPWHGDPEREPLFAFLLIQTHRFVLLHEAAHVLHGHGGDGPGKVLGSVVDGSAPLEQDEAIAASKMARELIADVEAFHLHFRLLEHEFGRDPQGEMAEILHEKLVGTPRERLRMTLLGAFLVFQILDYREWSIETARLRSHPPAPFRMKAIYATAVELKHPGLSMEEIHQEIGSAKYLGSAVVDIALNRLPHLGWLDQVRGAEFDAMFGRIYGDMHKWADPSRLKSA